ncbi:MAG TPA: glycosyltransferase [Solirubrobacteraceae bacterium]|jgi:glycosyltransferase involved in cell wall biosynthesis
MPRIISERYGRVIVRALVVSNMRPDAGHPERGHFVRDQVRGLRGLPNTEVELFEFPPGPPALLAAALSLLRRRLARQAFDVVHAHFGLTAWPALAAPARIRALTVHGTDVNHPRTRALTAAALRLGAFDIVAAVSPALVEQLPGASGMVLPCGVDLDRFVPISRLDARAQLGLEAAGRYLLFPADPRRPEKRVELAQSLARQTQAHLLTLGGVAPERVPLLIAASNAVVVPSEREGFGLAVLEALACDVPVLATPVGVHAEALAGVAGTLCAPFELERWTPVAEAHLAESDPRIAGRAAAEPFSAVVMAERVRDAWERALGESE